MNLINNRLYKHTNIMRLIITVLFLYLSIFSLSGCTSLNVSNTSHHYQRLPSTEILPIKNGQIEYVRFGHGSPAIIFINGYTADIASWDAKMLKILAQYHELIIFNNRNVGKSKVSSQKYNAIDLATDMHLLIKGLRLHKPAILGYSMGGAIAQQYVVLYPQDVGKLILINTFIAGDKVIPLSECIKTQLINFPRNPLQRFFVSLSLFFPEEYRVKAAQEILFHRFIPQDYPIDNFPSAITINKQQQLLLSWLHDNSTAKQIEKITLPTLILNGEKDAVISPINSVILAANIRHVTLLRWKNGGHGMIFQFPESIAATINNFLK